MDAVSSAPAPSGAEPPWLAITLAAITVIGPIAVAYVPVVSEARKARAAARNDPTPPPATPPPPPVSPPPPPPGEAYELMESAIADTRAQRDAALARADRLQHVRQAAGETEMSVEQRAASSHRVSARAQGRGSASQHKSR